MILSRFKSKLLNKLWYPGYYGYLLWPLALGFKCIVWFRRTYLQLTRKKSCEVPVIIVGNLTVGGVGKTPLVIELAKQLRARGLRVGIVSRGYGASASSYPHDIQPNDLASQVGDEPLLLAQKTRCPVIIDPKRTRAVKYLIDNHQSQIIISDDGLQHYAMARAIEMIVIDGIRGLGNELCLPAGPLRESKRRLNEADFVVVNGGDYTLPLTTYRMQVIPGTLTQLSTGKLTSINQLPTPAAAVAGIGHPERFFASLQNLGIVFNPYVFPDHHPFQANDLILNESTIVMTEKDAIKCQRFATNSMYFLPIEVILSQQFWDKLWNHPAIKNI